MSESKTDGRQTNSKGCQRGRKVNGAAWGREGRLWWAPNEQIMTGSILQDGVTVPPPFSLSPRHPPLLRSSSPLFSLWQFNFPRSPPCSCLLIVSEALSLGPPLAFGQSYRSVWEETGMSKCYLRQQTARGTLRPNVHPKTHQRCASPQRGHGREAQALAALIQKPVCNLNIYTLCRITEKWSPHALDGFSWMQQRRTERRQSGTNILKTSPLPRKWNCNSMDSLLRLQIGLSLPCREQILWTALILMLLQNAWCVIR